MFPVVLPDKPKGLVFVTMSLCLCLCVSVSCYYTFLGRLGQPTRQSGKLCLLPSLALNFAVMYSSPGNLALFLLAVALGQPERLRGAADQEP